MKEDLRRFISRTKYLHDDKFTHFISLMKKKKKKRRNDIFPVRIRLDM